MRLFTETQSLRARLWAGLVALVLWGCGGDDAGLGTEKPVASITVTPPTSTITPGSTTQLQATAKDADGATLTDRSITWSSGDDAVATVSATGLVVGIAAGSTTLMALCEGRSGAAVITVQAPQVPVAIVIIEPAVVALAPSQTVQLAASTKDGAGNVLTGRPVAWSSSNTTVASVSQTGLVSGVADGTTTITAAAEGQSGAAAITVARPILNFAAVKAGSTHTCGLTRNGAAYCWGGNDMGQLGTGSTTGSSMPVAVSGGHSFSALTLGGEHTCGLTSSGTAHCWGRNDFGQLGGGSNTNSSTPVAVSGGLSFSALAAGGVHTCGVTSAGAAYCWGWNDEGQLGNGSLTNSSIPVAVAGGLSFRTVASGGEHTCGLTRAGSAYCWGWSGYGELGSGRFTSSSTPAAVLGGLNISDIAAGFRHSCAITDAGAAYCWGDNNQGQVGDGTRYEPRPAPVAVVGGLSFSTIVTGAFHTCGLTRAGAAYCWGDDHVGELGDSSSTCETCESSTPVPVYGGLSFRTLASNGLHVCGLTNDGPAYCWGLNDTGQLGDGSTTNQSAPVLVAGSASEITAAALDESPLPLLQVEHQSPLVRLRSLLGPAEPPVKLGPRHRTSTVPLKSRLGLGTSPAGGRLYASLH